MAGMQINGGTGENDPIDGGSGEDDPNATSNDEENGGESLGLLAWYSKKKKPA